MTTPNTLETTVQVPGSPASFQIDGETHTTSVFEAEAGIHRVFLPPP